MRSIVSDITGVAQVVPQQQLGAAYGAAFLAGISAGVFAGIGQASRWVHYGWTARPDAATHDVYGAYYRIFRDLYECSSETVHRLARLAMAEGASPDTSQER